MKVTYDTESDVLRILLSKATIDQSDELLWRHKPGSVESPMQTLGNSEAGHRDCTP